MLVKQPSPSEAPVMAAGVSLLPSPEEAAPHQALLGEAGSPWTSQP